MAISPISIHLINYINTDYSEVAFLKNIPIQYRDEVLNYYRSLGTPIRLRYRGSRKNRHTRFGLTQPFHRSYTQSFCLLEEADRFSVYRRFN